MSMNTDSSMKLNVARNSSSRFVEIHRFNEVTSAFSPDQSVLNFGSTATQLQCRRPKTRLRRCRHAPADPADRARGRRGSGGCAPNGGAGDRARARRLGAKPPRSWSILCNGKSVFVTTKMVKLMHNIQPYES